MAMLLLGTKIAKCVPECEKCGAYMFPILLSVKDEWKCKTCKIVREVKK